MEATPEIANMVELLAEVKAKKKTIEEREEELKFPIIDHISPNAILTFEGREIASWKGQRRIDFLTDDFRRDHPDLYDMYTRSSVVRVLRLKKPRGMR